MLVLYLKSESLFFKSVDFWDGIPAGFCNVARMGAIFFEDIE